MPVMAVASIYRKGEEGAESGGAVVVRSGEVACMTHSKNGKMARDRPPRGEQPSEGGRGRRRKGTWYSRLLAYR